MKSPLIVADSLTKRYRVAVDAEGGNWKTLRSFVARKNKEITALATASFRINEGELVGYIGPNGAGKTTLLKLICGALKPTTGEIYIQDRPAGTFTKKERASRVSLVPQNPKLPEEMKVSDFVMLGRNPHLGLLEWESAKDFQVAGEAIQLTEIGHLLERKLGEISGGERQRVMLALAMTQGSPIMLLDEPTASLDISHQIKVMKLIKKIQIIKSKTIKIFHF